MKGAGGSEGGAFSFFIGFIMFCAGGYLFLNSVQVHSNFGFGFVLYNALGFKITTGSILIPFIFGIMLIFYNSKNILGWLLLIASLSGLFFGIIMSLNFSFSRMSLFDLLTVLVLMLGGGGLLLRSLKDYSKNT